jgi:uncharacterized protein
MPETLAALEYTYVPDVLERRAPHREAHLALLRRLHEEGTLVMAGATGDPVAGALIVFRDAAAAERFAADDPYGAAGLVAAHRVIPWTLVVP